MKKFIVVVGLLCFPVLALANPNHVIKECVSSGGQSTYNLNFSLPLKNGQIRYRFMGQDVLYSVRLHEVSDSLVRGRADFQSSASGETRGTSFDFTYNPKTEVFVELNLEASCR